MKMEKHHSLSSALLRLEGYDMRPLHTSGLQHVPSHENS